LNSYPHVFSTALLDPRIRIRVLGSAGVAYGLIFAAGFAAAFWGLAGVQLQRASVGVAWAELLPGLALCLPIGALAGWVAARARWSAVSILIWIIAAPLIAWIAGHLPYEGISWIMRLSDPYPPALPMYPFSAPAGAFTGLSMVIGAGVGLITGLLQLLALDRAWNYSTARHRLSLRSLLTLSICLPGAALFGLFADFQIHSSTRTALLDVSQAFQTALDPNRDLRAAGLPFLQEHRSQLTSDYTLYWVQSSPDLETTTVDVQFDTGRLLRCQHSYGQVFSCTPLDQDLRAWMEQLATRGRLTCAGCPVQTDREVRRWLNVALPALGALREVTFLQHRGGWLYQRATFDSDRSIDCRFRGHRPIVVDLCIEARP